MSNQNQTDIKMVESLVEEAKQKLKQADLIAAKYNVQVAGDPKEGFFFRKEWDDSACYESPDVWDDSWESSDMSC